MSEIEQEQPEATEISLPVNWHFPEGIQSRYANNILVQTGQFEFIISFFEMQPPLLLGSPDENKKRLETLGEIQAECVGKIVVPHELVPAIISVLQTEYDRFHASKAN